MKFASFTDFYKSPELIQAPFDSASPAKHYATDDFWGYDDVVYPGKHILNVANKNDTFTLGSINTDLRY